ncbi:conserved hypothetical protein [Gammaproteobacteria bacterium]
MVKPRSRWRYLGQGLAYLAFAAVVGYFSNSPGYTRLAADQAVIKLSFHHYGQRQSECRVRSAEEVANLPPNMRQALDCQRERSPIKVEMDLDDQSLYQGLQRPAGLHQDGVSYLYRRFAVPAGTHRLHLRLSDNPREAGFRYELTREVTLLPAQVLVIDFKPETGFSVE